MRIPSGVTDQYIYFVAVDATDFTTREASLTTPTVYRSRNNGTATLMTTPTIAALDATNMPGVFTLLLDEDMTIGAGNDSEEMAFHITATEMAPVTRTIELYRPKITAGNTLGVAADGDVSGNVDGSVASVVGHTAQTGDSFALIGTAGAGLTNINLPNQTMDIVGNITGNLSGSVGSNLELGPTEVNAQVVDVLTTDTVTEQSQGAPPAAPTMEQILSYLYTEYVRNKVVIDTNTANQKQVFADDGSTILYEKDLTNASNITTVAEALTGA